MASPRFNGQGFTNPTNPLGLHSENRYRAEEPLSNSFMSNEVKMAENARGNQEFNIPGAGAGGTVLAKKGLLKGFTGGIGKLFGRGAGKGVKGIVGEGGEEAAEAALKKSLLKTQQKVLLKTAKSPTKQTAIRVGGAVLVLGYGMNILGGPFVESLTGADCPEKAVDAGNEEGTEEYTKFVEDCQGEAANKVMMTGIAVIGVVGLIAVILLRPKKSE